MYKREREHLSMCVRAGVFVSPFIHDQSSVLEFFSLYSFTVSSRGSSPYFISPRFSCFDFELLGIYDAPIRGGSSSMDIYPIHG